MDQERNLNNFKQDLNLYETKIEELEARCREAAAEAAAAAAAQVKAKKDVTQRFDQYTTKRQNDLRGDRIGKKFVTYEPAQWKTRNEGLNNHLKLIERMHNEQNTRRRDNLTSELTTSARNLHLDRTTIDFTKPGRPQKQNKLLNHLDTDFVQKNKRHRKKWIYAR